MKKIILVLALTLSIFTVGASAQITPSPVVQDQCLVSLERESDLRKRAELERDAYKAQIVILEATVSLYQRNVAILTDVVKNLDDQVSKTGEIDAKTKLIIDNLREQVAQYRDELIATRKDLDRARRNGNIKLAIGVGAGTFIGTKLK